MSNSVREKSAHSAVTGGIPSNLSAMISNIRDVYAEIGRKGKTMEINQKAKRVQLVLSLPKEGGAELKSKLQEIAAENSRSLSNQIFLVLTDWVDMHNVVQERQNGMPHSKFLDGTLRLDDEGNDS